MKIAGFSDCHWNYKNIKKFPKADVVVFVGDYSGVGYEKETWKFRKWFAGLPYKHKILVPGNHDRWVENKFNLEKQRFEDMGIHLLVDEALIIDGVKFYGTPWCPLFNNWAFMRTEDKLEVIFSNIPEDTDILLSHTPPRGICDPEDYGSTALLSRVLEVKPKIHAFGHAHEGYGQYKGVHTTFYNVAVSSPATPEYENTYKLINPITLIDYQKETKENKNNELIEQKTCNG